jgi:hypothetical protein
MKTETADVVLAQSNSTTFISKDELVEFIGQAMVGYHRPLRHWLNKKQYT